MTSYKFINYFQREKTHVSSLQKIKKGSQKDKCQKRKVKKDTCTGLKKCNPTNLSDLPDSIAIVVTAREDVLEAKIADGLMSGPRPL